MPFLYFLYQMFIPKYHGKIIPPPPCDDGYVDFSGLSPLEMEICANEIPGMYSTDCCFTVIYYYYINDDGFVEMSITGIFYDGDDCLGVDTEQIIDAFYKKFWQDLTTQYPNFYWDNIAPDYGSTQYTYIAGSCVNGDEPCDPETSRCCRNNFYVLFDKDTGEFLSTNRLYNEPIQPPCPTTCTEKCNDPKYEPYYSVLCDLPCDFGEWTQSEIEVDLPYCPHCHIHVVYEYRETIGCTPEYQDYRLLEYELYDDCPYDMVDQCENCNYYTNQQLHEMVMGILLRYGEHNDLLPGQCKTNFRIVQASCWMHDQSPPNNYLPCSYTEGCCWGQYKVCRTIYDTYTYTLLDAGYSGLDCDNETQPCYYVCDFEPDLSFKKGGILIEQDQADKLEIIPNPNSGIFELKINSTQKGMVEIIISNLIGNDVFHDEINKTGSELLINIDISDKPLGSYNLSVKINGLKIGSSKFILNSN